MTRQEFVDNIRTWGELLSFCYAYDCDVCENIISHDELCDAIADDFATYSHEYYWVDIRDWLNSIDNNASYYYRDGSFDYTTVDDDFDSYKADVLAWCDEDASIFDDDDWIFDEDCIITDDWQNGDTDNDNELIADEHSAEDILSLLMTNFQHTKTG